MADRAVPNTARWPGVPAGWPQSLVRVLGDIYLSIARQINDPRLDVIATADLPAASTKLDGRILIEDAGAGNQNLILYSNGQRFRIDGGAAI